MNQEQLRSEFSRLFHATDLETGIESYRYVLDVAFLILTEHRRNQSFYNLIDNDANILLQMMATKCISILELTKGCYYQNQINLSIGLNGGIQDTFGMLNIVRSQFESFCTFNHIYINTKGREETTLLYNLWVIAGLNYRQKFVNHIGTPENMAKFLSEKEEIEKIINVIRCNSIFASMDSSQQAKIEHAIERKSFQVTVEGTIVKGNVAWWELLMRTGVNDMFGQMYNSLSLSTHPSNVSVFQFAEMYTDKSFIKSTQFAVNFSKLLLCFMIRDYCHYFPECKEYFGSTPKLHQHLINSYNSTMRSNVFKINNSLDNL